MIFRIRSTYIHRPTKEKLLDLYPFLSEFCLEDLGDYICTIKIENLEDLLKLHDLVSVDGLADLIILDVYNDFCEAIGIKKSIEIYDDRRE